MWVRGPNLPNYDTTSTTSKSTPMMTYIPLTLVSQPSLKVQCSRSGQLSHSNILGMQLVVHLANILDSSQTGADQEILVCNLLDEVLNDSARFLLLSFWNKLKEQLSYTYSQGAAEPTQGMPLVSSFT